MVNNLVLFGMISFIKQFSDLIDIDYWVIYLDRKSYIKEPPPQPKKFIRGRPGSMTGFCFTSDLLIKFEPFTLPLQQVRTVSLYIFWGTEPL